MTFGDERYAMGSPETKEKVRTGTVIQATVGEPAAFRQVGQWHSVALLAGPGDR